MPIIGPTTDHSEIRRWANSNHAVPTEVLPHDIDSAPALLRFMLAEQTKDRRDVRLISWEEFFLKFDSLGLALVYDDDSSGYNEILQIEERAPHSKSTRDAASFYN